MVYDPICHWVWGGGWLGEIGILDFGGSTVVHIASGTAALAAALVLKARKGFPGKLMIPHSLPLTLLGAGLFWFGWFGFNAGSALAADEIAVLAFTHDTQLHRPVDNYPSHWRDTLRNDEYTVLWR